MVTAPQDAASKARYIRDRIPAGGLFAGHEWRISPAPFPLEKNLVRELETLGRVLLQFYRSLNLLYRHSVSGKQPEWVARWLDRGKPSEIIDLQREAAFKNEVPRVIRPDILPTEAGPVISELDNVPGGIGLTAWLNKTYTETGAEVIGGASGMLDGFAEIFGETAPVKIVVSEEAATYRPEMEWLRENLNQTDDRFSVVDEHFTQFNPGDAVYRFFELFDLSNTPCASRIFELAREKKILLTPPPKATLEEKMAFALLWNRHLEEFWRVHLGESFLKRLKPMIPYTWVVDPSPLPPQAVIPELNLTDWRQLAGLSQRERHLLLKVSGFSETAWGARGVYLGSDLSGQEWNEAVTRAIRSFEQSPFILQRYHKPRSLDTNWFDFASNREVAMKGRVRLCPYYFVHGEGDAARAELGGVLATVCPADKKIIHGMKDAILAPCRAEK